MYDNTLLASILTGAQIKEYLEYSAQYFEQVAADAPVDPASWTNAATVPTTTTTSSRASPTTST
nr:hypothetical protein [Actinomadura madurae]